MPWKKFVLEKSDMPLVSFQWQPSFNFFSDFLSKYFLFFLKDTTDNTFHFPILKQEKN